MPEHTPDTISSVLAEFSTRLNEMEEKQRLLRDRAMLIGENLVSIKGEQDTTEFEIKKKINELESEIKGIKQIQQRIINELANFSRKTELEILKRQWEMFQPLEFVRIQDVEKMLRHARK